MTDLNGAGHVDGLEDSLPLSTLDSSDELAPELSSDNFHSLGLPDFLTTRLDQIGFTTPTPIQSQTIPLALEGHDVIGSAQTGTGKTAAYVLPLVVHLTNSPTSTGLILTPTREIALQVAQFIEKLLGFRNDIRRALLIGGEPMFKQFKQLQARPRLIIGTPGRVNDHLRRSSLNLGQADFLVLDEMDRMLDIGFDVQLEEIAKFMPDERQTLLFSATFPPSIEKASRKYAPDGKRISVGSTEAPTQNIKQETIFIKEHQKADQLTQELESREGTIIIFAKTKRSTEKLCQNLENQGHDAEFLHGDLKQNQRARTIQNFLKKKFRILVATDVAARGIDIPHIEHVINYDLPQCPEDYIHRIGRTARAGAHGSAITFVSPDSQKLWNAILHLMNPSEHKKPVMSGRGGRRGGRGRSEGKPFGKSERPSFSKPRGEGHTKKEWSPSKPPKGFTRSDRAGFEDRKEKGRSFEGRNESRPFAKKNSSEERGFERRNPKDRKFEDRGFEGRKDFSSPRKPASKPHKGGFASKGFDDNGKERPFIKDSSEKRFGKGQGVKERSANDRGPSENRFGKKKTDSRGAYEGGFGKKKSEGRSSPEGRKFVKPWEKKASTTNRTGKPSKPSFGGGQKPHFSKTKGRRRDAA